jgi:dTDP-4-dehydrorhamnose reductase
MKKVAVLGGDGQLGREIFEILSACDMLDVQKFTRDDFDAEKITYTELDNYLCEFDILINTIYKDKVMEAQYDPERSVKLNILFPETVAAYCKNHAKILFHMSTDYVYYNFGDTPISEEMTSDFIGNHYGNTKKCGEDMILATNPRSYIFRLTHIYGRKGNNLVEGLIQKREAGEDITCTTDQFFSPTNCKDIARVIRRILIEDSHATMAPFGVYNVASWVPEKISIFDFAHVIFELIDGEPFQTRIRPASYEDFNQDMVRPKNSWLDVSKAKKYGCRHWMLGLVEYLKDTGRLNVD